MDSIKEKVAFITGGAGGIGLAMVAELLKNGAKGVSIVDISEEAGLEAVDEMTSKFGTNKVIFIKTDVSIKEDLEEAFETTIKNFNQLDIVVNNAAIVDEIDWKKTISVNLVAVIEGTYLAMQKYLPKYKSGEEGVIVNTSSLSALIPTQTIPMYCTTKSGLNTFGKCLGGSEFYQKYKVRVLTLCPHYVDTPIFRIKEEDNKVLFPELSEKIIEYGNKVAQSPESVGKALVEIIRVGKNGSVWVQEFEEPVYEIREPAYSTMKVTQE